MFMFVSKHSVIPIINKHSILQSLNLKIDKESNFLTEHQKACKSFGCGLWRNIIRIPTGLSNAHSPLN